MIKNITSDLQAICSGSVDDHTKFTQVDVVRLCWLLLKLYFSAEYRSTDVWIALWAQCAKAVGRYYVINGWTAEQTHWYWLPDTSPSGSTPDELLRDDEDLARECLTLITSRPELYMPEDPQVETQIPTELIAALWLFTTPKVKQQFDQLRQMCCLPMDNSSESEKQDKESEDEESEGEEQDAESEEGSDEEDEGEQKNVDAEGGESGDSERRIAEADEHERAAPQLEESVDGDIGASKSQTLDMGYNAPRQETSEMTHLVRISSHVIFTGC